MKTQEITVVYTITKEEEGTYFLLPFTVPAGVERIDLRYDYTRHKEIAGENGFTTRHEINIVDLALCGVNGKYLGASGSDRRHIYLSGRESAQGYATTAIDAGEWKIVVGAYKVQPSGVQVAYTITFTMKERRLLRGDAHMHTCGSDGVLSVAQIAQAAKIQGLDYIFITDHNNYAQNFQMTPQKDITVLPGVEWTHYKGHMGMLGVQKPYENAFCINTVEEMRKQITQAKGNGAFLVLNHPFCPNCGWKWGFDVPFDAIEVWNGATPLSVNQLALAWWHEQLCAGKHIPIVGGSDFHRAEVDRLVGVPTTCLYAMSAEPTDILSALANGNGFISCAPDGPMLQVTAGNAILGETASRDAVVRIEFTGLRGGDIIHVITDLGGYEIETPPNAHDLAFSYVDKGSRFLRFEVCCCADCAKPKQLRLVSNPIYFE